MGLNNFLVAEVASFEKISTKRYSSPDQIKLNRYFWVKGKDLKGR